MTRSRSEDAELAPVGDTDDPVASEGEGEQLRLFDDWCPVPGCGEILDAFGECPRAGTPGHPRPDKPGQVLR
jgi:hypothetical protein